MHCTMFYKVLLCPVEEAGPFFRLFIFFSFLRCLKLLFQDRNFAEDLFKCQCPHIT